MLGGNQRVLLLSEEMADAILSRRSCDRGSSSGGRFRRASGAGAAAWRCSGPGRCAARARSNSSLAYGDRLGVADGVQQQAGMDLGARPAASCRLATRFQSMLARSMSTPAPGQALRVILDQALPPRSWTTPRGSSSGWRSRELVRAGHAGAARRSSAFMTAGGGDRLAQAVEGCRTPAHLEASSSSSAGSSRSWTDW